MVIDPNGEDEYEFDECGKLVNRITNDEIDQFHIVDANGQRLTSSQTFESNTFILLSGDDGKTLFQSLGKYASTMAEDAFVFFADNTNVEWEYAETNKGVYLGSSQTENSSRIGGLLIAEGHIISKHVHNHPSGSIKPSESDHNFAYRVYGQNSNAKLEIFTSYKQTQYDVWRPYDECTPYTEKKQAKQSFHKFSD